MKRFAAGIERWNSRASAATSWRGAGQKLRIDDEQVALKELHEQLQEASDTMKAQIDARAKQLVDYTKDSRVKLEQAMAQLKAVEAKKARIEAELSATKKKLSEVARKKVKEIAEEKHKAAEADLKEKKDKGKAEDEEPNKPDENDGAHSGNGRMTPREKLELANALLHDARETWKQTYQNYQSGRNERGARQEAAARERYFQLKGL